MSFDDLKTNVVVFLGEGRWKNIYANIKLAPL